MFYSEIIQKVREKVITSNVFFMFSVGAKKVIYFW
ncbi:hypothetical protein NSE_0713 [Neorickettsia sennetsu str. Miyayama]|uniref:Uncharacterized protein n=1 Tax=Ehrlichia sennetsu (strain ATCC VR-367 / Miyayama) TaxID=222891 RepID=Q2GD57_EHRS3|nr:hypothetical protein NSE_0713 [Neorickettsia sennetsu str. Miyayama]